MKFVSFIFTFLFLVSFSLSYSQDQQDSWASIKRAQKGKLSCVWNEAYGIAFKDEKGNLKGVCIDILNDFKSFIKEKYSVDLQITFGEEKSFSKFLSKVEGEAYLLGVSSVSITDDRKKKFQFTPYYLSNPNVIVTHRDAPKLTALEDLGTVYKGYTLKVVSGSTHRAFANTLKTKHYPGLTITEATSSRDIFNEISGNKTLFTIIDFGEYLGAFKNKLPLSRQPVNLGVDDKLGFVMNKKSDWTGVWQEFLTDTYRKSPAYKKIIADNLGLAYLGMIQ
jgi:ABC-type amino acid transport substrate-binding protein